MYCAGHFQNVAGAYTKKSSFHAPKHLSNPHFLEQIFHIEIKWIPMPRIYGKTGAYTASFSAYGKLSAGNSVYGKLSAGNSVYGKLQRQTFLNQKIVLLKSEVDGQKKNMLYQ